MTDLRIQRPERLLRDRVTDTLRKAVLDGVFNPGDRLTERQLVELTGVSRTSLREGLRQLQAEGLVEPAPGRGLQVVLLSEAELAELFEVREYLESAAVELFIANASGEQVTALVRHFADSPGHNDNATNPSSAYYEILFTGAGNALLKQLFGSITARIVIMQNLSIRSPGRAEESRREAEQTVAWIEARDSARAVQAARHHVRMAKESALQALRAKIAQPAATQPG
ncbi:GntR family transcriptional regulator [Nocardia anaemiae]|uniref:GntR family transcriptional regulator n=1 Tax=Nocardia anaemiae TaxID=263910 RepID=UPI0007A493C7|nr:GntR family transcriptional regulator [Nocardia anaemiae]